MEVCPVDKPMGDRGVTENYTAPAVRSTDQLDVMKNEPSFELANTAVIYRKPPAGLGDPPGWTGSGQTAGDPTAPAVAVAPLSQSSTRSGPLVTMLGNLTALMSAQQDLDRKRTATDRKLTAIQRKRKHVEMLAPEDEIEQKQRAL